MATPSKLEIDKVQKKSQYVKYKCDDCFLGYTLTSDPFLRGGHWCAEFRCFCGECFERNFSNLKRFPHTGCLGCSAKSRITKATINGDTKHPLYKTWKGMNHRCHNEKSPEYPNYGGRGIVVCDAWRDTHPTAGFKAFCEDVGERPDGMSLDRVDNNLGYCRENCRWATQKTQMNNISRNHLVEYRGSTLTLQQLAETLNIKPNTLYYRINRGWGIEDCVAGERLQVFRQPYADKLEPSRFMEMLTDRYVEGISLLSLEKKYGVSHSNLSRVFRNTEVLEFYERQKSLG